MGDKYIHEIDFGDGVVGRFTPGGRKRFVVEPVFGDCAIVIVNADVEFADGTMVDALLEIDEGSSGEHGGTGIFYDGGANLVWQDDPEFLSKLGKNREDVFPYRYRYRCNLRCYDHHIGPEGWSR